MNPAIALCEHLASDALPRVEMAPADVLDWYDGPVVAVVRCSRCRALALFVMLDWSLGHDLRIFAAAALEAEALEIFRRDAQRGSCDVTRPDREVHALLSAAGPAERLVAVDVASGAVRASAASPRESGLPGGPWQERLPPEGDDEWFRHVGLPKADGGTHP